MMMPWSSNLRRFQILGNRREACLPSTSVSTGICSLIVLALLLVSDDFHHWFVLPVFACGSLIGGHGIDWFRGRCDLLDPGGLLGVYGFHFFFLAPLLHVYGDSWMAFVVAPDDWREWLGLMACMNCLGILIYRLILDSRLGKRADQGRMVLCLDSLRFQSLLGFFLLLSLGLQAWVYAQFGGVSGYVAAFGDLTNAPETFDNLGFVFIFSEAFPVLALLGYVEHAVRTQRRSSWKTIALVLIAFLALKILFGGLRGSRANYVWPLFCALGTIHLWLRPISRQMALIAIMALLPFMYMYGFYKSYGADAFEALTGASVREEMADRSGRGFYTTLLGDLGRADVQAFLLYRLCGTESDDDFAYGWGSTYAGAACLLIPSWLWPDRPPTKVAQGTEALFGKTPVNGIETASNAYGLSGEAMLNFGPLAIPFVFVLLGLAVAGIRRWTTGLSHHDSRTLLVPFVVSLSFYLLVWDSDITLYYFVTNGALLFLIVMLSSRKVARRTLVSSGYAIASASPALCIASPY